MSTGNDHHTVDPLVIDAVTSIRDRFGEAGLRDLVALAQQELDTARVATAQLAEERPPAQRSGPDTGPAPSVADTQAWTAFVEQEPDPDPDVR